jgi:hypothetical protein
LSPPQASPFGFFATQLPVFTVVSHHCVAPHWLSSVQAAHTPAAPAPPWPPPALVSQKPLVQSTATSQPLPFVHGPQPDTALPPQSMPVSPGSNVLFWQAAGTQMWFGTSQTSGLVQSALPLHSTHAPEPSQTFPSSGGVLAHVVPGFSFCTEHTLLSQMR